MLKLRDLKLQPIPAAILKIHAQPLKNKKMTAESHQPDPKVTSPFQKFLKLQFIPLNLKVCPPLDLYYGFLAEFILFPCCF